MKLDEALDIRLAVRIQVGKRLATLFHSHLRDVLRSIRRRARSLELRRELRLALLSHNVASARRLDLCEAFDVILSHEAKVRQRLLRRAVDEFACSLLGILGAHAICFHLKSHLLLELLASQVATRASLKLGKISNIVVTERVEVGQRGIALNRRIRSFLRLLLADAGRLELGRQLSLDLLTSHVTARIRLQFYNALLLVGGNGGKIGQRLRRRLRVRLRLCHHFSPRLLRLQPHSLDFAPCRTSPVNALDAQRGSLRLIGIRRADELVELESFEHVEEHLVDALVECAVEPRRFALAFDILASGAPTRDALNL